MSEKITEKFLKTFSKCNLEQRVFESHFGLRCVSHTSTLRDHFLSTDTAGCVHLRPLLSTSLRYGRTSWVPGRCNGLVRGQQWSTANTEECKSVSMCVSTLFLLLEVHVMRPFPSPRQVQSSIIQPWYGFSQVSPTTYDNATLLS